MDDTIKRLKLTELSQKLVVGETVVILEGRDKGRVGRFMGTGVSSGYRVPFVALGDAAVSATEAELSQGLKDNVVPRFEVSKPYPYHVVSMRLLERRKAALEADLAMIDGVAREASEILEQAAEKNQTSIRRP